MIDSECSKFSVGKFAATIVLVIVCLVMLTPIIFAVINSFKPYAEMMTSFVSFPNSLDLNNYVKAWKVAKFNKVLFCVASDYSFWNYWSSSFSIYGIL